jgi:O-antigen ligase
VIASPLLWCGSLLMLWVGALAARADAATPPTALGFAVGSLALWMVATNLFANPYNAAALYQAAFLLGGYLYGRRAESAGRAYATALVFGVAISAWALWQLHAGGEQRPHGPFLTPATLATTLNLLLLPGLVLVITGPRRLALLAGLGVLCLALVASTSRGGLFGLAGAAVVTLVFARRARLPIDRGAVVVLGGLLILGFAIASLSNYATLMSLVARALAGEVLQARLELYRLALAGSEPSTWLFGSGYGAFAYLLEASHGQVPAMGGGMTNFVHNDYLQTLYELGVPGLAALLLLVAVPVVQAWRKLPQLAERECRIALAALAAILSMALHALVDFPFFVPLCVLMFGTALGMLEATFERASPAMNPVGTRPAWQRGLSAATVTLAVWILAVPAGAEAAAAYAERQWRTTDAERAAFWFEAARRIDPRDWRYHWYAAQFWAGQAAERSDPAAARLADAALAAASFANGRDVRPIYGRIRLHMRLRTVLEAPADGVTLRTWANRLVTLAPMDPVALAERARVFRQFPAP